MHSLSLSLLAQAHSGAAWAAGGFLILWVILGLAAFIFWIWMLVDVLSSGLPAGEKALWIVLMIIFPLVGSIIYAVIRRSGSGGGRPTATGY